jgi:hypothetical protein
MKKFGTYLNESTNAHMEHLEDNVLNGGVAGARGSINFLQSLRDMLAGQSASRVNVSVKWDGAPAIFAGIDPSDGRFYVAKKSIFNTTPKVYKTSEEVKADTSGDLQTKLLMALEYLPELGITNICYQGDFLFADSDLRPDTIEDEKYITFHPNTIVYAVPSDSDTGRSIKRAKIGIVWHTTYTGSSFKDMKASFGKDIASKLKSSSNVWSVDATYKDVSGSATMTAKETKEITMHLSMAGKAFKKVPAAYLNALSQNETVRQRVKTYLNSYIRAGQSWPDGRRLTQGLFKHVDEYFDKEIAKKKTAAGKKVQEDKRKEMMKVLSNPVALTNIFTMMQHLVDAKLMIVRKMEQAARTRTFLLTKDGYKVTGEEGYVAIDRMGKNAVKVVDRLQFSHANFSSDIMKGWQR